MSTITVRSATIRGLEAQEVTVTVERRRVSGPLQFNGLEAPQAKEMRARIHAALAACDILLPPQEIQISFDPVPRRNIPNLDLAVAVGVLVANCVLGEDAADAGCFFGELNLEGKALPVSGAICVAELAKRENWGLYLPRCNAAEAHPALFPDDPPLFQIDTLEHLIGLLSGEIGVPPCNPVVTLHDEPFAPVDMNEIKGLDKARRALEIAAAGGHNILLAGPPGCGKTLLARRMPTILPPMTRDEQLEVTKVRSVTGLQLPGRGLEQARPFRAPHHTCSGIALMGGGSWGRPGECTLAHRGVLFMDDLPEFRRVTLDVLRYAVNHRQMDVAADGCQVELPADFILVGAMVHCPCGQAGDRSRTCTCSEGAKGRFFKRVPKELFDICLTVEPEPYNKLQALPTVESSAVVRERVVAARAARHEGSGFKQDQSSLKRLAEIGQLLSGEKYEPDCQAMQVARTIANLDGRDIVNGSDVEESFQLRGPLMETRT